jgi:hypothetical protein
MMDIMWEFFSGGGPAMDGGRQGGEGHYISVSDVEVAAELHADVFGKYPYFNIGGRRGA